MSGTNRVILLTDSRTSKSKAAAVQSVIEVTGVEPPEAVRLLSVNDWNPSEAIADCVNLREFRERLRQAESQQGHRLCILSVHLIKLTHLKHTGMHSIRLDLDGDVQQTGWITGDHAKFVGVSFEFRRFRPESRLRIEVWHKRTFRENKMVGWCHWRIASLAEDPIMRFKGWVTLTHKETTGGSVQAEIWLRFFDLPPSSPSSQQQSLPQESAGATRQSPKSTSSSSTDRQRGTSSNATSPSSSRRSRAARVSFEDDDKSRETTTSQKIGAIEEEGVSTTEAVVEVKKAVSPKSVDLLDDFFGTSNVPSGDVPSGDVPSSASSSSGAAGATFSSWDLNSLDAQLFVRKEEIQEKVVEGEKRSMSQSERSSRSVSQERLSSQEKSESEGSQYRTPEEGSAIENQQDKEFMRERKGDDQIGRIRRDSEKEGIHVDGVEAYLVSRPAPCAVYPALDEMNKEILEGKKVDQRPEWDSSWRSSGRSSVDESYYPAENLPPDPWRRSSDGSRRSSRDFDQREQFVRQVVGNRIYEEQLRRSSTDSTRDVSHQVSNVMDRAPRFPVEDLPENRDNGTRRIMHDEMHDDVDHRNNGQGDHHQDFHDSQQQHQRQSRHSEQDGDHNDFERPWGSSSQ